MSLNIVGDFNIDLFKNDFDKDIFSTCGLFQQNKSAIRVAATSIT